MQNGYYQTAGAMVTQFNRLDVISNNLANINTAGYKRDDVVIADFERIFKDSRDVLMHENHTKDAAKFINRNINRIPNIDDVYTDFSSGGLRITNNPLDVAVTKRNSFLLVQTPNGVRLTKDGSFSIDGDGFLVTKNGYRVLPSDYETQPEQERGIQIPQNSMIKIDKNANLFADDNNIARLYIAEPNELKNLKKEGDNLFYITNLNELNDNENSGALIQGYIQISNVNPVMEMVGLVETNRLVDMYQKVMMAHENDLNQEATQKLASLRV